MIQEIAENIFVSDHRTVEGKNGVIFGRSRGDHPGSATALAIDTGSDDSEGRGIVDFITARVAQRALLAYTHGHSDHVLGSAAFRGAEVAAHRDTAALMRQSLPRWAGELGCDAFWLEQQLAWPTRTLAEGDQFDLGGRSIRILATPGHSRDHVSLLVEDAGVLFAGDAVVTGIVPTIHEGDGRILEATLRRLEKMSFDVLVPGHGPVLSGAGTIRAWIAWEAGYLAAIRRRVRELLGGEWTQSDLLAEVGYGEFVGNRFPMERHDMLTRHRRAVSKILAEERAGVPR